MLGQNAPEPILRLSGAEVDTITRYVTGRGFWVAKRSLAKACADAHADCTQLFPYSECIERTIRRPDCLASRLVGDTRVTVPCDLLDAWTACATTVPPDTPVITPGVPDPVITLPPQSPTPGGGAGLRAAALVGVGVAALAVYKATR
ncbi:hypothetical protein HN937_24520 [Candidatus Poribacteria bacterium]|nr:hypothetical protein [Candidatus Poribacteria bacterium]